jgi:hypothetical protein
MRIVTPSPGPRESGEYGTWVTIGYGDPAGIIHLAENGTLDLRDVHADDCDRLIRAASRVKAEILRYQAQMAAPHGRRYIYEGTCQLCGKPEDDELHAEAPAPSGMQDPAPVVRVLVEDDEHPDCARKRCGHQRHRHWEFGPTTPDAPSRGCDVTDCPCVAYVAPAAAAETEGAP